MHFFVGWGERNGEQALGSRWTGSRKAAGPSAPQNLAGEAGGPPAQGCIARSALDPGGAVLGWTRTWLAQPLNRGRRLRAVRGSRAPRGGSARTRAGTPARSGLSAKPAGGGQWGGWLVSRGESTPPLPPPPLTGVPPHPPRPTSSARSAPDSQSEQRWGPPAGGRCGHREFSPAEGSAAIPGCHRIRQNAPP